MRGRYGLAWGVLAGLAWLGWASASGPPPAPGAVQDVLFLGDPRPVLLRLLVYVEGRPFRAAWEEYLDKLFADLDRDRDGVLSPAEAARVLGGPFLRGFLQGELPGDVAAPAVPFAMLDTDQDGRVTRHELGGYYRRMGLDALVLQVVPRPPETDAVTDALFRLLDRDRDGKLSRQELASAASTLLKVDLDEDEFITPEELVPHGSPPSPARSGVRRAPTKPEDLRFLLVHPGEPAATLGQTILRRYDRNGDSRLSRQESEIDAETFAALDTDRNGTLDAFELARFVTRSPDQEVLVRVGERPANSAHPTARKTLAVELGNGRMEVHAGPSTGGNFQGMQQFYLQQFQVADRDRTGVLDRKQAEQSPYVNGLFALADRDADGKLTLGEFRAFLDLHAWGARGLTVLTVVDQGIGLFELLDADGDGRLSLRELNAAWSRVRDYDRDGRDCLSREAFPRRYQLWLSRGWPRPADLVPRLEFTPKAPAARGPLWFRNMDVNGDGDVSRREFLGSDEAFRQLDADGDGLISVEEAERAEALRKDNKERRPVPGRR